MTMRLATDTATTAGSWLANKENMPACERGKEGEEESFGRLRTAMVKAKAARRARGLKTKKSRPAGSGCDTEYKADWGYARTNGGAKK